MVIEGATVLEGGSTPPASTKSSLLEEIGTNRSAGNFPLNAAKAGPIETDDERVFFWRRVNLSTKNSAVFGPKVPNG